MTADAQPPFGDWYAVLRQELCVDLPPLEGVTSVRMSHSTWCYLKFLARITYQDTSAYTDIAVIDESVPYKQVVT